MTSAAPNKFVQRKIDEIISRYLSRGTRGAGRVLDKTKDLLYVVDERSDQIQVISQILEANQKAYSEHLKVCTNPEGCQTNASHEEVEYILSKELRGLGINTNSDTFTSEEKYSFEQKIDQIIADLKDVKDGQELIFNELEELKKWFILGKKNWKQLLLGKTSEMVAAGVISSSISDPLIEMTKELPNLIGGG
ncbi:hypothetical protein [Polaribacter sp. R77954]|uniref:hypothetical protein n=1 Tax=Polaribacter sp. R77954 TaxID=3093870 RepID=UPI0037C7D4C0